MKTTCVCEALGDIISEAGETMRQQGALGGNYFGHIDLLLVRDSQNNKIDVLKTVAKLERHIRFVNRAKFVRLKRKVKICDKYVDEYQLLAKIC